MQLLKLLFPFFKTLILELIKKQKLFNEENSMLFIDSTSIKVSPDVNKNRADQEQIIGHLKGANNKVVSQFYVFMSSAISFGPW